VQRRQGQRAEPDHVVGLDDREHLTQLAEQQLGRVTVFGFPPFPREFEVIMDLLVVLVVLARRVLPQHLGELVGCQAFPAGEEEQDGDRHPLPGEVELFLVFLVFLVFLILVVFLVKL